MIYFSIILRINKFVEVDKIEMCVLDTDCTYVGMYLLSDRCNCDVTHIKGIDWSSDKIIK